MSALHDLAGRPSPRTGDVLGDRYRLDAVLGTGGTAEVFRAADLRLRREVAVKVFRPGATAVSAERFCEEAVLQGRLAHPNLVPVYDAGRYVGGAYVVMHLVEGVTLRERIATEQLTGTQVARLGEQLALALGHAHAAGIVHRDVKPSNVLLGPGDAPFLADFGISRFVDEPSRAEPGTVIGTVPYLAPEQVLGKGSSPASDVYSLGLVLLEALKGEREFQGSPLEAGPARLLRSPEIPPWLPVELASVIEAMTRREPAERPDAEHCARLLHAAANSRAPQPVLTSDAPTHRSRTAFHPAPEPKLRRRRTVVAGLTAAGLLAAAGATLLAVDGGTSAPGRDSGHDVPAGSPSTGTPPAAVGAPLPANSAHSAARAGPVRPPNTPGRALRPPSPSPPPRPGRRAALPSPASETGKARERAPARRPSPPATKATRKPGQPGGAGGARQVEEAVTISGPGRAASVAGGARPPHANRGRRSSPRRAEPEATATATAR